MWAAAKASTFSARLARQAVADIGTVDVAEIEELWHGMSPPYLDLFAWLEGKSDKPVSGALAPFRPPMLAHPLLSKAERMEANDLNPSLISPSDFVIGPSGERFMAERASATITEVEASHAMMISQPQVIADVILTAVAAVS